MRAREAPTADWRLPVCGWEQTRAAAAKAAVPGGRQRRRLLVVDSGGGSAWWWWWAAAAPTGASGTLAKGKFLILNWCEKLLAA
jgi:hypothetical protein